MLLVEVEVEGGPLESAGTVDRDNVLAWSLVGRKKTWMHWMGIL